MLTRHQFWITLVRLFCATTSIFAYSKFKEKNIVIHNSIVILDMLGLAAGHARLIMLSIEYNWWWFFGGLTISIMSIRFLSFDWLYNLFDFISKLLM